MARITALKMGMALDRDNIPIIYPPSLDHLRTYIKSLRSKLGPDAIEVKYGMGYMLKVKNRP